LFISLGPASQLFNEMNTPHASQGCFHIESCRAPAHTAQPAQLLFVQTVKLPRRELCSGQSQHLLLPIVLHDPVGPVNRTTWSQRVGDKAMGSTPRATLGALIMGSERSPCRESRDWTG
jgi:hypothetical protein